jgi:hypothetical protein
MPVLWASVSLVLSLGAAWTAGWAYDTLVAARPQWALWISEAPILNRPELQLMVIIPLLLVLAIALIGGVVSRRAFLGKLATAISLLAILQCSAMAVEDIRDMAVLRSWAHLYYSSQPERTTPLLGTQRGAASPRERGQQ